jgi:hypothetical protein
MRRLVTLLETLRSEFADVRSAVLREVDTMHSALHDEEGLAVRGEWAQLAIVRNGHPTNAVPVLADILRRVSHLALGIPSGAVEVSIMRPGTRIRAHTGPGAHKWRIHVPLRVPAGARMRVTDLAATWREGEPFVFDDSFEHEVLFRVNATQAFWTVPAKGHDHIAPIPADLGPWTQGQTPQHRIVLILDVWHPLIDSEDARNRVREALDYAR